MATRARTRLRLIGNWVTLVPAALHLLTWILLAAVGTYLYFTAETGPIGLLIVLLVAATALLLAAVVSAIRLKRRILRRFDSVGPPAVRDVYRRATRVQWSLYALYYPTFAGPFLPVPEWFSTVAVLLLLVAVASVPGLRKVRALSKRCRPYLAA